MTPRQHDLYHLAWHFVGWLFWSTLLFGFIGACVLMQPSLVATNPSPTEWYQVVIAFGVVYAPTGALTISLYRESCHARWPRCRHDHEAA